ncbi:MAG: acetate kinase, partial [Gemmatimonadales bacterium]
IGVGDDFVPARRAVERDEHARKRRTRIVKYVGAYLAVLEGQAQAVVFTGGIGHGSPEIRRRVAEMLTWAGLRLDPDANARGDERISAAEGHLAAFAVRSDEEGAIAAEATRWFRA